MKSKYMQKHTYSRQNGYEEAVCNGRDPFPNYCVWVSVSQCFILCIFKIFSVLCSGTFHRLYLKHHNHKSYATRYPQAQSVIIQLVSLAKCCKVPTTQLRWGLTICFKRVAAEKANRADMQVSQGEKKPWAAKCQNCLLLNPPQCRVSCGVQR